MVAMSRSKEHESLMERYHAAIRAYTAAIKTMEDTHGDEFHEAQRIADDSRLQFQRIRRELRDELGAHLSEPSKAE